MGSASSHATPRVKATSDYGLEGSRLGFTPYFRPGFTPESPQFHGAFQALTTNPPWPPRSPCCRRCTGRGRHPPHRRTYPRERPDTERYSPSRTPSASRAAGGISGRPTRQSRRPRERRWGRPLPDRPPVGHSSKYLRVSSIPEAQGDARPWQDRRSRARRHPRRQGPGGTRSRRPRHSSAPTTPRPQGPGPHQGRPAGRRHPPGTARGDRPRLRQPPQGPRLRQALHRGAAGRAVRAADPQGDAAALEASPAAPEAPAG